MEVWQPPLKPGGTTVTDDLRARIAAAIRDAAHWCDGDCGQTEAECDAKHPLQVAVWHHDIVADVVGPVDVIAGVVMAVVQPIADERDRLAAAVNSTLAVAELIEANGVQWAAAAVRRALSGGPDSDHVHRYPAYNAPGEPHRCGPCVECGSPCVECGSPFSDDA